MPKYLPILATLLLAVAPAAFASDHQDDVDRTQSAARVFQEIMNTPDKGIPDELLEKAKCIAIVPGTKKFAFIWGGNYGRGVATCRTNSGWSAPIFIAVEGGSFGFQIGGSSTDIVLLFMNQHALESLLGDKFKLGGDATVAAGPVGRAASAGTDVRLNSEVLSYSRAKGLFAGISLEGTVVMADKSGDSSMYGHNIDRHEILNGSIPVPMSARRLIHELSRYPAHN